MEWCCNYHPDILAEGTNFSCDFYIEIDRIPRLTRDMFSTHMLDALRISELIIRHVKVNLPAGVFDPLKKLQYLKITNSDITTIYPQTFRAGLSILFRRKIYSEM